MSFEPRAYLRHIVDEADYLLRASADLTVDDFKSNETLRRAFVRSLEIIGEAAKKLPPERSDCASHGYVSESSLSASYVVMVNHLRRLDMPMIAMRRCCSRSLPALLLIAAGCDRAPDMAFESSVGEMAMVEVPRSAEEAQAQAIAPRFIRNAIADVDVSDINEALLAVRSLTERLGGVVAESELTSDPGARSVHLVLRVPAESLDSLLDGITSAGEPRSVTVSSSDVSREYFDTETRLAVKEGTVRRLTVLVDRSASVEDLVAVERELSRAMTELETLKGQIRYFDAKVDYSDVRVTMTEARRGLASATLRPVTRAFRNAGSVLAESVAALVYLVAFLLPWLLVAVLLWPLGRRVIDARRQRKASV